MEPLFFDIEKYLGYKSVKKVYKDIHASNDISESHDPDYCYHYERI